MDTGDSAVLTVGVKEIIVTLIPVMTHDKREIDITMTEVIIEIDRTKTVGRTGQDKIVVTFIMTEKTGTTNLVIIPTNFFFLITPRY